MKWFEISPKLFQVRFYDEHPDKYEASFQIYVESDRGILYSLNGFNFYERFSYMLADIMQNLKITQIEATVARPHFRAIKNYLKTYDVEIIEHVENANREMVWISIKQKGSL